MKHTIMLALILTSFGSLAWAVPIIMPMEVTKPAMEATVEPRKNIIMPIGESQTPASTQAPVTQSTTPPAKSGGGGAMGYLLPLLALLLLYKKEEN